MGCPNLRCGISLSTAGNVYTHAQEESPAHAQYNSQSSKHRHLLSCLWLRFSWASSNTRSTGGHSNTGLKTSLDLRLYFGNFTRRLNFVIVSEMEYMVDQPLDAFIQTKKGRGRGRGRGRGGRGRGGAGPARRNSFGGGRGGGGGFRRQSNRVGSSTLHLPLIILPN